MFTKVLSILVALVVLSIYWKTRLTPHAKAATHFVAFGGDMMKTARYTIFSGGLMLVGYYLMPVAGRSRKH